MKNSFARPDHSRMSTIAGKMPATTADQFGPVKRPTTAATTAIAYPAGAIAEYFGIAVSVIVLFLLWSGRASTFFRD